MLLHHIEAVIKSAVRLWRLKQVLELGPFEILEASNGMIDYV